MRYISSLIKLFIYILPVRLLRNIIRSTGCSVRRMMQLIKAKEIALLSTEPSDISSGKMTSKQLLTLVKSCQKKIQFLPA